eukprot:snap_masked-scaffold814_size93736-processed-gene-0.0 protein:Tk05925 transcript:snap_masked-scaffold814_size93736-processed-gene-0.0-mRNA-1 annotation:"dihydroorotate dehydrogenase"
MGFSLEQWYGIKEHCDEANIEFMSSPFSQAAVDLLEEVGVKRYKIGSDKLLAEGHDVSVIAPIDEYIEYKEKYPTSPKLEREVFGLKFKNPVGLAAGFDKDDYFVVNVSSPNTPGLRDLQDKEPLTKILSKLMSLNAEKTNPKPILLKIAPDLTNSQLDDIIAIVADTKIHGVVATNTTIDRSGLHTDSSTVEDIGNGGLSEKWAVTTGGCQNYRDGLYDWIMIKDNHIDACGNITKAVQQVHKYFEEKGIKLGIPVMEGYGLTETSPTLTINRFDGFAKVGTVGVIIDGVDIIIDKGDGDYKEDEGEILAKGPNIMRGYYNKPDKTAELCLIYKWDHLTCYGTLHSYKSTILFEFYITYLISL